MGDKWGLLFSRISASMETRGFLTTRLEYLFLKYVGDFLSFRIASNF
jgi:hypothetical protein